MHPIRKMVRERRVGGCAGIASYCTANDIVIAAAAEDALRRRRPLLIEATANQVNQFGGYTGMRPADFSRAVRVIAADAGLPVEGLILGGDHLGPLLWQGEPEASAMDKAETLVRDYVRAGFDKIHLDTSMRVADDDPAAPLPVATVAARGARLARAAMEEWRGLGSPSRGLAFVIGSEVPVPGGTQHDEECIQTTSPEDFATTVETYRSVFLEQDLAEAWENVVGVVVQPGVEFSDANVFQYRPKRAAGLTATLERFPALVFEGHSTDYQTDASLKAMVRDGVGILKVGPELTFSLREGLFAMDMLEEQVLPANRRAGFRVALEQAMLSNPANWEKYYHGDDGEKHLARRFSFSDRCRYYLTEPGVRAATARLMENFDAVRPPLNIVHQFLPAAVDACMDSEYPTAARLIRTHLGVGTLKKFQSAVSM